MQNEINRRSAKVENLCWLRWFRLHAILFHCGRDKNTVPFSVSSGRGNLLSESIGTQKIFNEHQVSLRIHK